MVGEASGIAPDRGMNVLYRVTQNTLLNITSDGLTASNTTYNSSASDVRITSDTPNGIIAGMCVKAGSTNGTAVKADGSDHVLGVALNNAVGYPFESISGVASGKIPYLQGSGSVFSTDVYEVYTSASAAQTYAAGDKLYCSANGLLTKEAGIGDSVEVGICINAPTSTDPFMVVQMTI